MSALYWSKRLLSLASALAVATLVLAYYIGPKKPEIVMGPCAVQSGKYEMSHCGLQIEIDGQVLYQCHLRQVGQKDVKARLTIHEKMKHSKMICAGPVIWWHSGYDLDRIEQMNLHNRMMQVTAFNNTATILFTPLRPPPRGGAPSEPPAAIANPPRQRAISK